MPLSFCPALSKFWLRWSAGQVSAGHYVFISRNPADLCDGHLMPQLGCTHGDIHVHAFVKTGSCRKCSSKCCSATCSSDQHQGNWYVQKNTTRVQTLPCLRLLLHVLLWWLAVGACLVSCEVCFYLTSIDYVGSGRCRSSQQRVQPSAAWERYALMLQTSC